jgi:hypothetical protein
MKRARTRRKRKKIRRKRSCYHHFVCEALKIRRKS